MKRIHYLSHRERIAAKKRRNDARTVARAAAQQPRTEGRAPLAVRLMGGIA